MLVGFGELLRGWVRGPAAAGPVLDDRGRGSGQRHRRRVLVAVGAREVAGQFAVTEGRGDAAGDAGAVAVVPVGDVAPARIWAVVGAVVGVA